MNKKLMTVMFGMIFLAVLFLPLIKADTGSILSSINFTEIFNWIIKALTFKLFTISGIAIQVWMFIVLFFILKKMEVI